LYFTTGGVEGVFDIDVMVNILRRENCADICVVTVPPGNNSPKYVVVSTCKSKRHLVGQCCGSPYSLLTLNAMIFSDWSV